MSKYRGLNSAHKVCDTKALPNMSRSLEAKALLDKIAVAVAPLMLRRKWHVGVLKEFYPREDGLLGMNVNRGQSILIRLRMHQNKDEFFSWEHVMGTMIHELSHMEISDHSAEFYKLMDEIGSEVDKDQIAQISGRSSGDMILNAFSGQGHRLGGKFIAKDSDKLSKANASAMAALARAKSSQLNKGSGQTLSVANGRSKPPSKEELRSLVVAAAERRRRDESACRSGQLHEYTNTTGRSSTRSGPRGPKMNYNSLPPSSSSSTASSSTEAIWICALCDTPNISPSCSCSFCTSPQTDSCIQVPLGLSTETAVATTSIPTEGQSAHKRQMNFCQPCSDASFNVVKQEDKQVITIDDSEEMYTSTHKAANISRQGPNWICQLCFHENKCTQVYCEMCHQSLPKIAKQLEPMPIQSNMLSSQSSNLSPTCTQNVPVEVALIPCPKCTFVNDIQIPLLTASTQDLESDVTARFWLCTVCSAHVI